MLKSSFSSHFVARRPIDHSLSKEDWPVIHLKLRIEACPVSPDSIVFASVAFDIVCFTKSNCLLSSQTAKQSYSFVQWQVNLQN